MSAVVILAGVAGILALAVAAGAIGLALWNRQISRAALRQLVQAERETAEARKRAEDAETALTEIRMKRSLAVSKGNRTRAELERARIRETTEAVRAAAQRKRQPQGQLL